MQGALLRTTLKRLLEHRGVVDAVALASVITLGVLGVTTPGIAVWTTRRNVRIDRENRVQQRLADGYLKVLSLAEQQARWLDASEWLAAHDTDDNDGSDGSDGSGAHRGAAVPDMGERYLQAIYQSTGSPAS